MQLDDARQLAAQALEGHNNRDGRMRVLLDQFTRELPRAWLFAYESAACLKSGQFIDRLIGNGPIYVHKDTGEVSFLGSYGPWERVVADFERARGLGGD